MHKIKNRTAPSSFLKKFEQLSHSYSTCFLSGNYRKPQIKFRISIRGPAIWNDLVRNTEKEIQSSSYFETKIKSQLLNFIPLFLKNSQKHRLMATTYYNYSILLLMFC